MTQTMQYPVARTVTLREHLSISGYFKYAIETPDAQRWDLHFIDNNDLNLHKAIEILERHHIDCSDQKVVHYPDGDHVVLTVGKAELDGPYFRTERTLRNVLRKYVSRQIINEDHVLTTIYFRPNDNSAYHYAMVELRAHGITDLDVKEVAPNVDQSYAIVESHRLDVPYIEGPDYPDAGDDTRTVGQVVRALAEYDSLNERFPLSLLEFYSLEYAAGVAGILDRHGIAHHDVKPMPMGTVYRIYTRKDDLLKPYEPKEDEISKKTSPLYEIRSWSDELKRGTIHTQPIDGEKPFEVAQRAADAFINDYQTMRLVRVIVEGTPRMFIFEAAIPIRDGKIYTAYVTSQTLLE